MMSILQVVLAHHARGFQVCNILGDGGFKCIINTLSQMGIMINVASRNKHIPEIEWYIRTITARVRDISNSLPCKK